MGTQMTLAGYQVADIAALKAIAPQTRFDGQSRMVVTDPQGKAGWYIYRAASTNTADDDWVVIGNDNPVAGRYERVQNLEQWTVVTADHQARNGEKIIVNSSAPVAITLPAVPIPGLGITLASTGTNPIAINLGGRNYKGMTGDRLSSVTANTIAGIVYVSTTYGYMPTADSFFTLVATAPAGGS